MYYKLDENKNVVPSSLEEWTNFIEGRTSESKHVGDDEIRNIRISTIFLGIPYGFDIDDLPLVFETMVFDSDENDIYMKRYSTYKQAEEGHQDALAWVKNGCPREDN